MTFNKIDIQTWNRKEAYDHYLKAVPCTYSMTINLDITELISTVKRRKLKFFPIMLYGMAHTVNHHAEFRMDLDEMKNLGYYSYSNPCYTVFHSETETFTNVWTEYDADFDVFMENYSADMLTYQNDFERSKPLVSNNLFHVSCIPWSSFTGFNLNLQQGYGHSGKFCVIAKRPKIKNRAERWICSCKSQVRIWPSSLGFLRATMVCTPWRECRCCTQGTLKQGQLS